MTRTETKPKTDDADKAKLAERKPILPPLHLPKHLKPLTGPTGSRRVY